MIRFLLLLISLLTVTSGCSNSEPFKGSPPFGVEEFQALYPPQNGTSTLVDLTIEGIPLQVHRNVAGEGPDLVLLHGICDSLHTWDGWVAELQNDFRILRVDYPPFGLTGSFPDGVYTEERMFAFLDALLLASAVKEPFYIAGNSLGGGIAWRYATARPGKIKKMVLIDPAGFVDEKTDLPKAIRWADSNFAAYFMRKKMPRSTWQKTVRELYGSNYQSVPEATFEAQVNRFHNLSRLPNQCNDYVDFFRYILGLAEADTDEKIADRIGMIDVPVQLLWGEADLWFPPLATPSETSNLAKWKEALKVTPSIHIYPGVGHMPQLQNSRQTARDARAFLLETHPE